MSALAGARGSPAIAAFGAVAATSGRREAVRVVLGLLGTAAGAQLGAAAMVAAGLAAWYLMGTRRALVRWEAAALLAGYLVLLPLLAR